MDIEKKDELLEILPPEKEVKKPKGTETKKPEQIHRKEETQPFHKMLPRKKVEERLVSFRLTKGFSLFLMNPFERQRGTPHHLVGITSLNIQRLIGSPQKI